MSNAAVPEKIFCSPFLSNANANVLLLAILKLPIVVSNELVSGVLSI